MSNGNNLEHAPPSTIVDRGHYMTSYEVRGPDPQRYSDEVHLREYLDVIIRRRWLIINCLFIVVVSMLIVTLSQTKLYKSSTTIEVGSQNQKVTKFENVETSSLRSKEYYDTQVQLVQSRQIAERVVDRLSLEEQQEVIKAVFGNDESGLKANVKSLLKDAINSFSAEERQSPEPVKSVDEEMLRRHALVDFVKNGLQVSSSRTSMLIDITFISPNRFLSQAVANGVADEFVSWKMERNLEKSDLTRNYLTKQIDRAKIDLEKSEKALNRYAKKARIVSLDPKMNSVLGQLEKLNEALAVAKADLIEKKTAYLQAQKDGPSALPDVMESALIGQLKAEYASIHAEYERMGVTFHDEYPAIKALIGRMNSIKKRIQAEEEKVLLTFKHHYEASQAKVAKLEERLEAQKQLTLESNDSTNQYAIIAREVETNKQIYQSLLERSREIESMAGINSGNIHIVDEANLPLFPSKPNVKRNMMLTVVLGLICSIGIAFFIEYFTDRVANPDEISDRYQIPILGLVPLAKKGNYQLEKAFVENPQAPFTEAIRTIRVALQFSGSGDRSKSFVITSTKPNEGKTTLASNLALTFAETGEKVVIVDADLRRPRIHKVFGTDCEELNCSGLSSYLAGDNGEKLLKSNGIDKLDLLTAGPIPPNPIELLASARFGKLMKALEMNYDRVILDAPPHQGFADILVLCQHVGGVVLVNSQGEITRESLRHFKKSMVAVRGHIIGCIINKVSKTKQCGYQSSHMYCDYYSDGKFSRRKRQKLLS